MVVLATVMAWAAPAGALSVEQVLRLRQAGVSDRLIQDMLRQELAVARQGGVGRYVVRQAGGRETIVYYAASATGAFAQPLPLAGDLAGSPQVRQALGAHHPSPAATAAGYYTLHLASHRSPKEAEAQVARLKAKGVSARVQAVDLKQKGRWHRVLLGRFKQRAAAQEQGRKLRQAGSIGEFTVLGQ